MKTGLRSGPIEVSTVDTALLLGGVLFAQSYFDGADAEGSRDPATRRRDLPPRRLALGAGASPCDLPRLDSRIGLHRARLAGLQRGDARLHPGARLSHPSGRARRVGGMGTRLRALLGRAVRAAAPHLHAALRPPVLACLDRFPRHRRRPHAHAPDSTTSRIRGARPMPSALMPSRTRCAGRVTAKTSGD